MTGKENGAGTDANVAITLFGSGGNSGKQALTKKGFFENLFERGKTDVFTLDLEDLGETLYKGFIFLCPETVTDP